MTDPRFTAGEIVYAKTDPTAQLRIRRYYQRIYYCTIMSNPTLKEKVYFDRELMGEQNKIADTNSAKLNNGGVNQH